jgi:PAS domain S-box-containing protein
MEKSGRNKSIEKNSAKATTDPPLDSIIATDKDLNITTWNKGAEDIFGWQSGEVLVTSISQQVIPKVLENLNDNEVMKCLTEKGSWSGEANCCKKDGSRFSTTVSLEVIWNSEGNFNGITAVHNRPPTKTSAENKISTDSKTSIETKTGTESTTSIESTGNASIQDEMKPGQRTYRRTGQGQSDITARTQHPQATALLAKESEGKNRDLVDNIKLGIFRCTTGIMGKFLEVNKAMEEINGYSREELLEMDVRDILLHQ